MDTRFKVFAYITHQQRLLVMAHPHVPEAGIQVPAGTLEPGESPEAGVLREAWEETGLDDLRCVAYLGEQIRDMRDYGVAQIHHRHFFHLTCPGPVTERWRHDELHPSDGGTSPITFEFYWVSLPHGVPPLIADHGRFLPDLVTAMGMSDV